MPNLLLQQVQELADKMQQDQEEMECSVCMEAGASTALIPCGHCFCCSDPCGSATVLVCPCCRYLQHPDSLVPRLTYCTGAEIFCYCRAPVESRQVIFGILPAGSQHSQLARLADALGVQADAIAGSAVRGAGAEGGEGGQLDAGDKLLCDSSSRSQA